MPERSQAMSADEGGAELLCALRRDRAPSPVLARLAGDGFEPCERVSEQVAGQRRRIVRRHSQSWQRARQMAAISKNQHADRRHQANASARNSRMSFREFHQFGDELPQQARPWKNHLLLRLQHQRRGRDQFTAEHAKDP